jgi:hypothetical protein
MAAESKYLSARPKAAIELDAILPRKSQVAVGEFAGKTRDGKAAGLILPYAVRRLDWYRCDSVKVGLPVAPTTTLGTSSLKPSRAQTPTKRKTAVLSPLIQRVRIDSVPGLDLGCGKPIAANADTVDSSKLET